MPDGVQGPVYNTLNLLAHRGVIKTRVLRAGCLVFDGRVEKRHHSIDEETGQIDHVPWEAIHIRAGKDLAACEIREV